MEKFDATKKQRCIEFYEEYFRRHGKTPSVDRTIKHFRTNRNEFYRSFLGGVEEVCRLAKIPVPQDRMMAVAAANKAKVARIAEKVNDSRDRQQQKRRATLLLLKGHTSGEVFQEMETDLSLEEIQELEEVAAKEDGSIGKLYGLKSSGWISSDPTNLCDAVDELISKLSRVYADNTTNKDLIGRQGKQIAELSASLACEKEETAKERAATKRERDGRQSLVSTISSYRRRIQELEPSDNLLKKMMHVLGLKSRDEVAFRFVILQHRGDLALSLEKDVFTLQGKKKDAERNVKIIYQNAQTWLDKKMEEFINDKVVDERIRFAFDSKEEKKRDSVAYLLNSPEFHQFVFRGASDEVRVKALQGLSHETLDKIHKSILRVKTKERKEKDRAKRLEYEFHSNNFNEIYKRHVKKKLETDQ